MADEMVTQLRTITFSEERRGFDKREVREFLTEVAGWVEGGGGDVVRRRLERIAHKSAKILADAEDGAECLRTEAQEEARTLLESTRDQAESFRTEAEAEVRQQLQEAKAGAASTRDAADRYAAETRASADDYAEQTRLDADQDCAALRKQADLDARETVSSAEQRAERIIAAANQRRLDIETVINDLQVERDRAVLQVRELAAGLVEAAERSAPGNARPSLDAPRELTHDGTSAEAGVPVDLR